MRLLEVDCIAEGVERRQRAGNGFVAAGRAAGLQAEVRAVSVVPMVAEGTVRKLLVA